MPTPDLAAVTRTLQALLSARVSELAGRTVNITSRSPERVSGETNVINVHLYHVREDPHFRNAVGTGGGAADIARAPIGLSLYYIVTAHHDSGTVDDQDALEQQSLLGFALKALHDMPVIRGGTEAAEDILDPSFGDDDELQIILRPLTPEDAVTFWSAEDQQTARLSAYYEVRVVFLEPDEPEAPAPPVLSLGAFFTDVGAPRLEGTESVILFAPPGYVGEPVPVTSRPARVVATPGGPPEAPHNHLRAPGTHLGGIRHRVFVAHRRWATGSDPIERVEVTPASGWSARVGSRGVGLDIAPTIDAGGVTLDVLPGLYTLAVEVVRDEVAIAGRPKELMATSNEVAFFVGPLMTAHAGPDAAGRITVTLEPIPTLDQLAADGEVELVVAGDAYALAAGGFTGIPVDDAGTYIVTGPGEIVLHPRFATDVAGVHALRLLVSGAESRPFWIVLEAP